MRLWGHGKSRLRLVGHIIHRLRLPSPLAPSCDSPAMTTCPASLTASGRLTFSRLLASTDARSAVSPDLIMMLILDPHEVDAIASPGASLPDGCAPCRRRSSGRQSRPGNRPRQRQAPPERFPRRRMTPQSLLRLRELLPPSEHLHQPLFPAVIQLVLHHPPRDLR